MTTDNRTAHEGRLCGGEGVDFSDNELIEFIKYIGRKDLSEG